MQTYTVGKVDQVSPLVPLVVEVAGMKVGICKLNDRFVAYENECAHEGGPIMEGDLIGHFQCSVAEDGRRLEEYFSQEKFDLVCPWHGMQYDLETGICTGDKRRKLTPVDIIVDGNDIKLKL
jgi:nitrite reductase (NADH) small subunit